MSLKKQSLSRGQRLVLLSRSTNHVPQSDESLREMQPAANTVNHYRENHEDKLLKKFLQMQNSTKCYLFTESCSDLNFLSANFLPHKQWISEIVNNIVQNALDNISSQESALDINEMEILDENLTPLLHDTSILFRSNIFDNTSELFDNLTTLIFESSQEHSETHAFTTNAEVQHEVTISSSDLQDSTTVNTNVDDQGVISSQQQNYQSAIEEVVTTAQETILDLDENQKVVTTAQETISDMDENESKEMFSLDTGCTKLGEARRRKKFLKTQSDRANFLQEKRRKKHLVRKPCKCKLQCMNNFNEEIRTKINDKYWKMNFKEKKTFLSCYIEREEIIRRRKENKGKLENKKNSSNKYYLKGKHNARIRVCKEFFLSTLGYAANNDFIVRVFATPPKDCRGCYERSNRIDKELIKDHVKSFSPCVSHYRREHAPNRLYLPLDLTIRQMYDDFCEKNLRERCSYEFYRQVVSNDLKISFTKLGHEACEKCEEFILHNPEHTQLTLDDYPDCEICQLWKTHIEKARFSREQYRKDAETVINTDSICVSADMQKVIMLPRLEMFKRAIFTTRIVAFNESFIPVGKINRHQKPFAALWHEAIAGRKKEDIVSAYNAFFKNARDYKNIVIWVDNCAGQNKNWCLFSYLVYIINSGEMAAETITMKYFEVGHTFMSADSFHHSVEQNLRKNPKCYDFQDFSEVVKNCKASVTIKCMTYSDFYDWPTLTTPYQVQKLNKNKTLLKNIFSVKATKGLKHLIYQEYFGDELKELHFIPKKNMDLSKEQPKQRTKNRGISENRKQNILRNLTSVMPSHKLKFWEQLDVNDNAKDLTETIEDY